jgi:hypothetical protein
MRIIKESGWPCHVCWKKGVINKTQITLIDDSGERISYCSICHTEKAMSNTIKNRKGLQTLQAIRRRYFQ